MLDETTPTSTTGSETTTTGSETTGSTPTSTTGFETTPTGSTMTTGSGTTGSGTIGFLIPIPPILDPDDPPSPSWGWDYADLGVYVAARLRGGKSAEDTAIRSARRSSIEVWYAGYALTIVRNREGKDKGWVAWIEANRLSVTNCYEAMRLYQRSGSVENVRALTIGEAREKFQVAKAKWSLPGGTTTKPPKRVVVTSEVNTTTSEINPISKPVEVYSNRLIDVLTHDVDNLTDTVTGANPEEWRSADHETLIIRLETAIEVLQRARRAIKEANRTPRNRPSRTVTTSETV